MARPLTPEAAVRQRFRLAMDNWARLRVQYEDGRGDFDEYEAACVEKKAAWAELHALSANETEAA